MQNALMHRQVEVIRSYKYNLSQQ